MTSLSPAPEITDAILAFSADTRFEDLPDEVVHEARRYVVDAVGCMFGGHAVDKGRIAAAHAARLGGPDEAGIVGRVETVSAPGAAFANAELLNALDHDSLPHVVPITLPAVLAAAQAVRANGRDLIAAVVVAHEIGQRLNRAASNMIKSLAETGSTPAAFGIHDESVVGAALGACRLFGHTRPQRAHAIGLAAYFGGLPVARDWEEASPKSMAKYTPVGLLAQNALQAAMLARAGFTGHPQVLDAPFGFGRFRGTGRWEPGLVVEGLGSHWTFMDQQYKRWPCCRFFHSQLDLLDRIVEAHGLEPAQIDSIDSHGPRFVANARPYDTRTQTDVQFSLPFCMALVAHRCTPDAGWQSHETLAQPRLHTFARRVRMHADPRSFAARREDPKSWWARVEVTLKDGRTLRDETLHASGTNGAPTAWDDATLDAKFRRHASTRLSAAAVEAAGQALWSLEAAQDVRALAALLTGDLH